MPGKLSFSSWIPGDSWIEKLDKNPYIYYNVYMKKSKAGIWDKKSDRITVGLPEKKRNVKTGELKQEGIKKVTYEL